VKELESSGSSGYLGDNTCAELKKRKALPEGKGLCS
jgi:hypothetical protein